MTDLRDGFHKLGEFGKYILAGREYPQPYGGYEFVTWQYTYDSQAVEIGHYYSDNYDGAKQSLAIRSGLVDERLIFKPEQLIDMYLSLEFYKNEYSEMTYKREDAITETMSQIEGLIGHRPSEEPDQNMQMDV